MDNPFKNFDSSKFKMGGDETPPTDTPVLDPPDDDTPPADDTPTDTPPSDTPPSEKPEDVPPTDQPPVDTPEGGPQGATEVEDYTEEDFVSDANLFISERSGGRLKSVDEVESLLKRNEELEAALKVKEPEFSNPKAKILYDTVIKAIEGRDLSDNGIVSTAANYLRLVSFDLAKATPKEKQLEAYILSRPDISRLQAEKIFEKRYEQKFTDLEGDEIQQDEHGIATRDAEQKILNFQKEFAEAKKSEQPKAPGEVDSEVEKQNMQNIENALSDFGGLSLQFGDQEEAVNLELKPEEVSDFKAALQNPMNFLGKVVFDRSMVDGKFNWAEYTKQMFRLYKSEEAIEEAHRAGVTLGQVKIVKDNKNTATSKTTAQAPKPESGKKTFGQTMAEAIAASNKT